ncbi:HRDC domain-containing protein [Pedobacter sp. ASV28]|uniref:HRDC domain-containing protein n=1 Tax=Pedobacter sp. ASV28 TaxID=2795123 RepID=UPI0018EB635D|nr:HRDC domain-containing protein [Pedobacter sp. ASV28]
MKLDSLHELIIDFIENTNKPIFLTGKAGTGKTTFLRYIRSNTKKNLAVVAPTAVAAINAGGVTIHSFFQAPFGPIPPTSSTHIFQEFSGKSFGPDKTKLIKCLDLLIIDEISMVRADTLDYIDRVLRFLKGNSLPFGGVQLLMIGDLYQLPPVFQNDWHFLGRFYKGPYFFDSLVFKTYPLLTFELTTVHRQSDPTFIDILNEIRNGAISPPLLEKLNQQYQPVSEMAELAEHVTLTTHNPLVKKINQERLEQLPGETYTFKAKVSGDFPKEAYPTEEELVLKAGAMVMFIKNDSSGKKQFYNGRTAKVVSVSGEVINLTFFDDGSTFEANLETWENTKYALSETDQKVTQTSAGSFTQFPIRLAWAITIHKSQGLTFDKAIVDVGAAFAHGQTYVALSRCRTLEGLLLREKVNAENIITDPSVSAFMTQAQSQIPDQQVLAVSQAAIEIETLILTFDFMPIAMAWSHFKSVLMEILPSATLVNDKINTTERLLGTKVQPIGERFIRQELQTLQGKITLQQLKERLVKAAGYFLPSLSEMQQQLQEIHLLATGSPYHSDYFPTLNLLLEQLGTKIQVFQDLPVLKNISAISQTIRTSAMQYKPIDGWKQKQTGPEVVIENPALYTQLIAWRTNTAAIKKTLDYLILSDQAMADISAKLPRSLTQLAKIKNIGEGKTAEFGEHLLKMIRTHLGENDLFG